MNEIHRKYDSWRTPILILMMVSYGFYFVTRSTLNFAAPIMQEAEGISLTKEHIGGLFSIWGISYSIGKFVTGFVSIYFSPRRLMFIGLLGSSLMTIAFPFFKNYYAFLAMWFMAGLFQSIGWPQCVRLMSHWYRPTELGTKWGIASIANQLGTKLMYGLFTLVTWGGVVFTLPFMDLPIDIHWDQYFDKNDWRHYFWLTGVISLLVSLVVSRIPLFTPERMGLPSKEERYDLPKEDVFEDQNETFGQNTYKILFKDILPNKMLWCVALANTFFYVMRTGYTQWAPTFYKEYKGFDMAAVGENMFIFELSGAIGGIMAGLISDKLFRGRRGLVGTVYMFGVLALLGYIFYFPITPGWGSAALMFALGFIFFGPQIMAGAASVDFATKRAAVAANAFVGACAQIISAPIAGYVIGALAQNKDYGWPWVFSLLGLSTLMGALFFWFTRNGNSAQRKTAKVN